MYSVIKLYIYIDDFQHSKIKHFPHYFSPRVGKSCSDLLLRRSVGVSPGQIRCSLANLSFAQREEGFVFASFWLCANLSVADLLEMKLVSYIEFHPFSTMELNHHGGWINERSINSLPRRVMDDLLKSSAPHSLATRACWRMMLPSGDIILSDCLSRNMKFPWKLEWTCRHQENISTCDWSWLTWLFRTVAS